MTAVLNAIDCLASQMPLGPHIQVRRYSTGKRVMRQ
jgi:hypothetical protein